MVLSSGQTTEYHDYAILLESGIRKGKPLQGKPENRASKEEISLEKKRREQSAKKYRP
jgi:hypothetical protein